MLEIDVRNIKQIYFKDARNMTFEIDVRNIICYY